MKFIQSEGQKEWASKHKQLSRYADRLWQSDSYEILQHMLSSSALLSCLYVDHYLFS